MKGRPASGALLSQPMPTHRMKASWARRTSRAGRRRSCRRQANIEFVQAQSIRNKKMMDERDPVVREQSFAELRKTAADPKLAKDFLIRSSMIASVRRAAEIN